VSHELDYSSLGLYFALKNISSPATAYAGIRQLPPGHMLRFHAGALSIQRWWEADFTPFDDITPDEAALEIRRLLEDAVKLRIQCDVPFGAYLSGGIDSTAVTTIMSRLHNRPVQTFCLGYRDGKGRQMQGKAADIMHAAAVARRLGTEHHELFISGREFREAMPKILGAFDEPFSGTVSTFFLSALIAEHVTVALSGDGADELFGSYLTHRLSFPIAEYLAEPGRYEAETADRAKLAPFDDCEQFAFLRLIADDIQGRWYDRLSVFSQAERTPLLNPEVFPAEAYANPYAAFDTTFTARDPLNKTLELDQAELLPNQILPFVDRLSMAHSVEVRCPFLDFRLVEFVNRLPGEYKIHNGINKFILKRALSGLVPEDILCRPKEGFVQPVYTWMNEKLHPWMLELLDALPPVLFQKKTLEDVIDKWRNGASHLNPKIWNLACFSVWWNDTRTARDSGKALS
jgi:asparagine synthase (glutamine-hydrolysing)